MKDEQALTFGQKLKRFWAKAKERYGITSDWHAIFVLFIFAIAGSSIMFVMDPILELLGQDQIKNQIVKFIVRVLIVLPVYYLSLFLWSNILGQGKVFNPLIKKMILGWLKPFKRRKK